MSWNAGAVIRTRREQFGFSQADLATAIGVTKSFLSLVEAGKRQLSELQVGPVAHALGLPPDLLVLATGKLPGDLHDLLKSNAAEIAAAVRQRTDATPLIPPSLPSRIPYARSGSPPALSAPIPSRINVTKTSTAFRAHSYHTKVPPEAIRPFLRAFSRPGDLVFDPFCGSGMTGVACLFEGRDALLSDLSPAAVHISRNYTTPCDVNTLNAAIERVKHLVAPTMRWLYCPIGTDYLVEYTTWSDVYRCPACNNRILYWDLLTHGAPPPSQAIRCRSCGNTHRKTDLQWVAEEPVQTHVAHANRVLPHPPTQSERQLIAEVAAAPVPYWTPRRSFGPAREMWRAAHRAMGITDVADFFSPRNLHALAALRHAIVSSSTGRTREALLFAFTAAVNRASKRYQWNAKRPTNVMTGTLYISSLRYEWNVWSLFRRKAADVVRYYAEFPQSRARVDTFQHSAQALHCLPDHSVDMVFMDPPFGSNIFYADSSFLWESWLGRPTDQAAEIVINRHRSPATGGKTLADYGEGLHAAFAHVARVLKPTGRAVLAFSNSDDAVWDTVQQSLRNAGLSTAAVHLLSKGQPSIKGVKGVTGKERVTTLDLLISLERRSSRGPLPTAATRSLIQRAVAAALRTGGRLDEIYSATVRTIIESGHSVVGVTMPAVAQHCRRLGARESSGRWKLTSANPSLPSPNASNLIAGYLTPPSDLPQPTTTSPQSEAIPTQRFAGGRNSTFYLAHSYHTKVPPEAIRPFIDHYTSPGDIILDPFSGSGMTGVAASLSGRQCILHDLSPAAAHLSWNHTRSCDPSALRSAFDEIAADLRNAFQDLYGTYDLSGAPALIHWTVWSTEHQCPTCNNQFLLWDSFDRLTGRMGACITCPVCRATLQRSRLPAIRSRPAWIAYETSDGRRLQKTPDSADVATATLPRRSQIADWFPTAAIEPDREMYLRCALHLRGVRSVPDFYTDRNLAALASLWAAISKVPNDRVKRALMFAFTNTAWHGTRMRRFNARGGQRPLTGTLYIPQLSCEANVLAVMSNKVKQLQRYYAAFSPSPACQPAVLLGTATNLEELPNDYVDYVFTDPPFGSNIYYADCNLIWESWLGRLTDHTKEAVVNRARTPSRGGRSLHEYGAIMTAAMAECFRVLKPGGWATVVFHNTNPDVWRVIRESAQTAGFLFYEAAALDRKQQSHKGYKGRAGAEAVAHFDVVFNLQKPTSGRIARGPHRRAVDVEALVIQALSDPAIASGGVQAVHSEVMRRLVSLGSAEFVEFTAIRDIYHRHADRQGSTT